ncbi:hypothetical protein HKCCSP123_10995 [Rhodobacterales bacterium HKCCSP123]|nr:hypothetical protein [Rhodobacterales bacterium HKCCSP123]
MTGVLRLLAGLALVSLVAGCVAEEVWAPEAEIEQASYSTSGPPTVRLLTMVSNVNGSGGHSALVIDGAERLVFDPAGSWHHPLVPERNDVLYGMSPQLYGFYMDYHARETYHILVQELQVTAEQAAALSAAVQSYGAVPSARCTRAISTVLAQTPGFQGIRATWFPVNLSEQFASLPGVAESRVYDDDSDDNLELLQAQARAELSREIAAEAARD